MGTDYFPGRKEEPFSFYVSCNCSTSTLIGYKTASTICPFMHFVRYPVPGCGPEEDQEWWHKFNEAAELLFGEGTGLYRLHVTDWEELFEDQPADEWGFTGRFVYFILSDESCAYRLSMAFE